MKLAYSAIFTLTLLTGSYASTSATLQGHEEPMETHKPKLSWLQRLRIGTTVHDGKFVSHDNPLHPEHKDHPDAAHPDLHPDLHPRSHEEEVILQFFGHQFPHSKHPVGHSFESCTGLHAETEENLKAVRRLMNSAFSLIDGLEWSNDPGHIAHEHHHLLLDDEPWRTTCDDMAHSTVMELKMIEALIRGSARLVSDLEKHWSAPHHFAPEHFPPESHDAHHHDAHSHEWHPESHHGFHEEHGYFHGHEDHGYHHEDHDYHHEDHGYHHEDHGHPSHAEHDSHSHPEEHIHVHIENHEQRTFAKDH